MALRFASGFDALQTSDLTAGLFTALFGASTQSIQTGVVRNGARALQLQNNVGVTLTNPAGAQASFVIGGAFRFTALANRTIMAIGDGGVSSDAITQVSLALKSDGTIEVFRGRSLGDDAGGISLGAGSLVLAINTWYYIEFKGTISNTGSFSVRVNNSATNLPSGSGVQTQTTANPSFTVFGIAGAPTGGGSTYVDDLVFLDGATGDAENTAADFLGDVRIVTSLAVAGNGFYANSTPSTGTDRGAMVDETTQDGDTTYNGMTVPATVRIDTYERAALGVTGTIHALVERNLIRKSDAGTATARNVIRISSTNYSGATESPSQTYAYINTYRTRSPATTSPWTVSEIDAAQTGWERVS